MSKFILVTNKEDRNILKKLGLQEVSKEHGKYYFINEPAKLMTFNKNDIKLVYTNKLTF